MEEIKKTEYTTQTTARMEEAVKEYEKENEKPLREMIIPGEIIAQLFPVVEIEKECVERVLRGQPIYDKNLSKKAKVNFEEGKVICVFSGDKFIGMFKVVNKDTVFAKSEFTMQEIR